MNENESKDEQAADDEVTIMLPADHPVVRALDKASFTWGSYQYDSTAVQYADLCKQEAEHGRDAILAKYGIKMGTIKTFDGDTLEGLKNSLCVDVVDPEVVGDDTSEIRKMFDDCDTVTKMLNFLAEQAWDLWSGVPYITTTVFPELDLGKMAFVDEIGTLCWLLKSYGYVEDDEPFKDWDT